MQRQRQNLFQSNLYLPRGREVILVAEVLPLVQTEAGEWHPMRVIVKRNTALVSDPVILALNMKAMQMFAPPEEKTQFAILRTLRKSASFKTTTYRLALQLWSRHASLSPRSQHADLISLKSLACKDFLLVSSPPPVEGHLNIGVELGDAGFARNQQTTPHHGTYPGKDEA